MTEYKITYEQAAGVVALMVEDAKEEMIRIRDKGRAATNGERLRFDACQRWLMNQSGGLEVLLCGIPGINVRASLFALFRFATNGWKTAPRIRTSSLKRQQEAA